MKKPKNGIKTVIEIENNLNRENSENVDIREGIRGGFRVQNEVVINFCKIDFIYITIIALIFVVIIMIIVVVLVIIVNVASGDWSMTI